MPVQDQSATRRRGGRSFLIAVVAIAVGLFAWESFKPANDDPTTPVTLADVVQHGSAAGFNLLLISLDTTRPDHLGCYGYAQARTPTIDSLLDHGVRFDDAVTSAPLTLPSHATILTGRYPPAIGVRDNGSYRLADQHVTLAEILKDHGYDTAAFVSAFVLDRRFGLDQGFEDYDFQASQDGHVGDEVSLELERRAHDVTSSAVQWLQSRHESRPDQPFFLWVHYFDPHQPYNSPIADVDHFRDRPYDAEIAFVDLHLKRLLDAFDRQGLRERTLIVLVSDHGEALFDHGEAFHGVFIYESTMRVALLLSCPTLFEKPFRVDDRLVGTVDILPTVLELFGLSPPAISDGRSLLARDPAPERTIYIETCFPPAVGCAKQHGLRRHTDKYILAPKPEFYDLRKDRHEQENLYDGNPAGLALLTDRLAQLLRGWDLAADDHAAEHQQTPEEIRRLEALGYVMGGSTAATDSLPDCKDQIDIVNQMTEVTRLIAFESYEEALELATEVAAQSEGFDAPVLKMAECYARLDRLPEAAEVLGRFAKAYPSAQHVYYYAKVLFALGRYDEMLEELQAAELLDPRLGAVPVLRGDYFVKMERYREAVEQYERAIAIDGERLGPTVGEKLREARKLLRESEP